MVWTGIILWACCGLPSYMLEVMVVVVVMGDNFGNRSITWQVSFKGDLKLLGEVEREMERGWRG